MSADLSRILADARAAQTAWAARPVAERVRIFDEVRHRLAERAEEFAQSVGDKPGRTQTETLIAEVLPLADGALFLAREAPRILAPRKVGRRGRPAWMMGVASEVRRIPLGVVLVIGPNNYPLFLAGAQAMQALAAGNACLIKPAPGCSAPVRKLAELLAELGLDPRLLVVLDETPAAAQAAIEAGVDKVVLTGSAETGIKVLHALAPKATPAVMELSGCDAVFVLPGADLDLVSNALRWGLRLNGGATCIAPRRVFAEAAPAKVLEERFAKLGAEWPAIDVPAAVRTKALELVRRAVDSGARLVSGSLAEGDAPLRPLVLAGATPEMDLLKADVFMPVLSLVTVESTEQALAQALRSPYALGASIFGPPEQARRLAERLRAGSVSINDLIAPTADPRLPFGGLDRSGFGVTRGEEGLLEMTAVQTVMQRAGTFRPHYEEVRPGDHEMFLSYLQAAHGRTMGGRLCSWWRVFKHLMRRR